MTEQRTRLAEVLGLPETLESKIKHLWFLRVKAEGRWGRAMEKEATALVGSKEKDEAIAARTAEENHIAHIDREILRLNRGY